MTDIIRQLPYAGRRQSISLSSGQQIEISNRQVVLWVSVTAADVLTLPTGAVRIPVILDSGFNENFLIQEDHLREWCGISPESLDQIGRTRVRGTEARIFEADLWIHPNITGSTDVDLHAIPFQLELNGGMIVCPAGGNPPRLPLFGMRAIESGRIEVVINGAQRTVSMRAP